MRILIVAFGSRGDVAPFTGLGVRLQEAGHRVTIAAHALFTPMVAAAGLDAHDLPGDMPALLELPADPSPRFMARRIGLLTELLESAAQATLEAAGHTDLVLMNSSAPFARDVAEGLGLPSMGVYSQPMAPTGDFPPIVLNSARSWGRLGNRVVGEVAMRTLVPFNRASARLRARLGLPRRSPGAALRDQDATRWPVLHGYSPAVLPRPADWRPGLDVVGYWWPVDDPAWTPPARLAEFLAAGPPPVFIGFGSMAGGHGARLGRLAADALRQAGVRGIVQAGWAGLDAPDSPDVLTVGDVPHSWLFPRMAAAVHHAGAGTTAAALRAGIPSVPVPVYADQPLWAARLTALDAAPTAIPFRSLTADGLAAAIRVADRHAPAARTLAERIAAEVGAGAAVAAVARIGIAQRSG